MSDSGRYTVCNKTVLEHVIQAGEKSNWQKDSLQTNAQLWQQLLQFSAHFSIHCFKETEEITSFLVYFQ